MSYIDGFVLAVPKANREKFIGHARTADEIFIEAGAIRVLECWQDDVPKGKVTDFYGAVKATEDEVVCFAFIEWPDKDARNAGMKKIEQIMHTDPRMDPEKNPMPFDGKRMIFGGFETVVKLGKD
ncbi:MAG: DUF1428 domain-containing protein [Pseudomonadota bacterium]|nr:RNA signal recognition particle [Gammaproteobacteria bacterium]MBJ55882.1 RNA signal recognition particle [Gammaproteobacteria bacterium]MBJ56459.1 RNA signal recognition particle [Gammaproteobacteria bacterium]MEC8860701.1 DUF1428 domain-containing protein [Pseudomonadota bacterium]HBN13634.1 DUF1428 domain-containing protein [Pseudohongiella sp.]|tara:strand:- start:467 stop:841 length:375 start_codon:yes stop_codon:yes gene_type:complete